MRRRWYLLPLPFLVPAALTFVLLLVLDGRRRPAGSPVPARAVVVTTVEPTAAKRSEPPRKGYVFLVPVTILVLAVLALLIVVGIGVVGYGVYGRVIW